MSEQESMTPGARRQFSVGSVIGASFAVYGRNFLPFVVLGLVLSLPSLLMQLYVERAAADVAAGTGSFGGITIFGTAIVSMIVQALLSASVTYGTIQDLRGTSVGFGNIVSRGLSSVFPVIIASLLAGLAISFGFVLLIIPGIILMLILWVYVPAIVVEKRSITESFGRSAELTKGRRWHILGLVLLVFAGYFGMGIVLALIFAISAPGALPYIQFVAEAILAVFAAIMVSVCYYFLRAEKEGVDIDEIAKVFD